MMHSRSLIAVGVVLTSIGFLAALPVNAQLLGPTPYLSSADSPFTGLSTTPGGYFFLDNIEDHALNTPGVSSNATATTVNGFSGSVIDSVDADDGLINGTNGNGGVFGDSLFLSSGVITVTFNAGALGTLPTHAGLVWTDGGVVTFEAFNALGGSLGVINANTADGNFNGGTAEDRFYGAINSGGISRLTITTGGGIEIDHVQYGTLQNVVAVPEAGTFPLLSGVLGLCAGAVILRRRKSL